MECVTHAPSGRLGSGALASVLRGGTYTTKWPGFLHHRSQCPPFSESGVLGVRCLALQCRVNGSFCSVAGESTFETLDSHSLSQPAGTPVSTVSSPGPHTGVFTVYDMSSQLRPCRGRRGSQRPRPSGSMSPRVTLSLCPEREGGPWMGSGGGPQSLRPFFPQAEPLLTGTLASGLR